MDSYPDDKNNPMFRTAIYLGGIHASEAVGYSKKASHQEASRDALQRLEKDQLFCERVLATCVTTEETATQAANKPEKV